VGGGGGVFRKKKGPKRRRSSAVGPSTDGEKKRVLTTFIGRLEGRRQLHSSLGKGKSTGDRDNNKNGGVKGYNEKGHKKFRRRDV